MTLLANFKIEDIFDKGKGDKGEKDMIIFVEPCVYPFVFFQSSKQYFDIFSMAVQSPVVIDFNDSVFSPGDDRFVVLRP